MDGAAQRAIKKRLLNERVTGVLALDGSGKIPFAKVLEFFQNILAIEYCLK